MWGVPVSPHSASLFNKMTRTQAVGDVIPILQCERWSKAATPTLRVVTNSVLHAVHMVNAAHIALCRLNPVTCMWEFPSKVHVEVPQFLLPVSHCSSISLTVNYGPESPCGGHCDVEPTPNDRCLRMGVLVRGSHSSPLVDKLTCSQYCVSFSFQPPGGRRPGAVSFWVAVPRPLLLRMMEGAGVSRAGYFVLRYAFWAILAKGINIGQYKLKGSAKNRDCI